MSEEIKPKKAKKKTQSQLIEEEVQKNLEKAREDFIGSEQVKEIIESKTKEEMRHMRNKELIKAAMDSGLTNAIEIGERIGMTFQGVHIYAKEMGIEFPKTDYEKQLEFDAHRRSIEEEAEKFRLGLKGGR